MNKSIGIIGGGFVGSAIKAYYKDTAIVYDKYMESDSFEEVADRDIVFVAVPTPYTKDGFDRTALDDVFHKLHKHGKDNIVIIKSTIIPGTTDQYQEKYPDLKIIFNPEFLTEATAVQDFCSPNRQIIGYTSKSFIHTIDVLSILPPAPFERIINAKEAEIVKYFTNSWYATKVTFANEFYNLCQNMSIDYNSVKECVAADRHMTGASHLEVLHKGYRGYGGKCLPKDTRTIIQYGDSIGTDMALLKKVEALNNRLRQDQDRKGE